MTKFAKVSLVMFGLILSWVTFAGGIDLLSRGRPVGLFGVAVFIALLVSLSAERFRSYLATVTSSASYPARVFVACGVLVLIFLPRAISTAADPLTATNIHITRSLIYTAVAAGLSIIALLTNGFAYFAFDR